MSNDTTPLTPTEALQAMRCWLEERGAHSSSRYAYERAWAHLDAIIARVEATPAPGRVVEVGEDGCRNCPAEKMSSRGSGRCGLPTADVRTQWRDVPKTCPLRSGPVTLRLREGGDEG